MKPSKVAAPSPRARRRALAASTALVLAVIGAAGGCGALPGLFGNNECAMVDEPYYATSADLESAADVIVRGTITSIRESHGRSGPTWVVGFDGETATGPHAEQAEGAITIDLVKLCDDELYGDSLAVGAEFIMLLSSWPNGYFTPINTSQGVIPIVDEQAIALARGRLDDGLTITITAATAEAMGVAIGPGGREG